ncbi:MAG: efflux RND transporter periplasmic adaptor subunit [Treponemataceae bacterium]|nr:efflux RND transporter periplasmic adaptor subunit [Treponemataceae bacterium]
MRKISKKTITIIAIALILAFFVTMVVLIVTKKKASPKEAVLPVVSIQQPERRRLVESVTISGYVEANAMIPVVPFVAGTITEYPVCAGDFVKKDTLLAKIDDAPFRQQAIQAKAAYLATESTFKRVEALYKAGATTQQNYDTTKAQYDASKAQYDLAQLQLNYTEVRAPVAGTVLIADMAVGSIGNQQQPVAVLADLSNLVVRLKVPEKYFDLFTLHRNDLIVTVTRPAEKGKFEDAVSSATIKNIAPYVSPESKNFQVVCHLNNPEERFRPGMYVKVQVAYKVYEDVLTLPIQTKKMDGSCYIYQSESQTVKFLPDFKTASDGEYFIVPEEYEGCDFVIDGQTFVYDGQKVKLFTQALKEYGREQDQ